MFHTLQLKQNGWEKAESWRWLWAANPCSISFVRSAKSPTMADKKKNRKSK